MPLDKKRLCLFPLLLIIITGTGCATWHRYNISVTETKKYRIAVLPVEDFVKVKKLKSIQTLSGSPIKEPDEAGLIKEKMQNVTSEITAFINQRLQETYFYDVVPEQEVKDALKKLDFGAGRPHLTPAEIQQIGKILNAQFVLTTKLSGYGKIQKRWLVLLIGTGFAEGTVEGIAAAMAGSALAGALIGAEEAAQELLTWGGGALFYSKVFSPVILEEHLYAVEKGRSIWYKTEVARMDRKGLKKYSKEEQKKKELRLRLTSEMAVRKIVRSLEKLAWRNVTQKI